jgi:hypothetical protein
MMLQASRGRHAADGPASQCQNSCPGNDMRADDNSIVRAPDLTEEQLADRHATEEHRERLGNCLRRLKALAPLAIALLPIYNVTPPLADGGEQGQVDTGTQGNGDAAAMRGVARRMGHVVDVWGLRECHAWPALIDGNQARPF